MSSRTDFDSDPLVSARKIMAGLSAHARRGRVFPDGAPEWERMRWLAFRYFVLVAPGHAVQSGWRALAGAFQRRRLSQLQMQGAINVQPWR